MRNFIEELRAQLLPMIMAFELRSVEHWSMNMIGKHFNRFILLIDYVPFIGPIYNASYALNLLFKIWPSSSNEITVHDDHDPDDTIINDRNDIDIAKSRMVRIKGMTAIATALIDVLTLCLSLGVIAYVCDALYRIDTYAIVRPLLILFVIVNMLAVTIGSKLITEQLVQYFTEQLEEVNTVSTSMVKSVTITATAIERFVETTHVTSHAFWRKTSEFFINLWNAIMRVYTFPQVCYTKAGERVHVYRVQARQTVWKARRYLSLRRPAIKND